MGGILNIIIGIALIVGGLSGHRALIGTNSGGALAVIGACLIGLGIFRIARSRR
jgi:hypothetical protein